MKEVIIEDLRARQLKIPDNISWIILFKHILYSLLFFPSFACVFFYRVNHWMYIKRCPGKNILNIIRFYIFSNDIGYRAKIGKGLRLVHVVGIVIGGKVIIGNNVTIFNDVTLGGRAINEEVDMPIIGNNVLIGTGAKLIGGINIGNNVIVGANTFCDKDIPSNSVAIGNPLRIIKNQKIELKDSWKFYVNKK